MNEDELKNRYPNNSIVRGPSEKPGSEKRVSKVTKGKVTKKEKNLGGKLAENFLATDMQSVGNYLIFDVLIPGMKEAFLDMMSMLLNGDKRGDRTIRDRGRSSVYVPYNRYHDDRRRDRDKVEQRPRSRNIVEDLIFDSRGDAEIVLSNMIHRIEEYEVASVRDLYGYADLPSDFTKERYGWSNLDEATITRVREGYLLKLPRPVVID